MKKIIDFSGIEKYYCIKHKRFHRRFGKNGKKTIVFVDCQEHAYSLSPSEKWKMDFNKSWQKEKNSKKPHTKQALNIN